MSAVELVVVAVVVVGLAVGFALAVPPFLRGFREARERRGIDLNMEHRVEQELAEERAGDEEWRERLDAELDETVDRWKQEGS